MDRRRDRTRPPLIRCDAATAIFLGARPLTDVRTRIDRRETMIPVRTRDGRLWLWPVEMELKAAIMRA